MWGCDAPAAMGWYWKMRCPKCDGWDDKCDWCQGSGQRRMDRCPPSFVNAAVARCLDYYSAFKNGVLPDAGSWADQTARFARIVRIIEGEIAFIRNEKEAGRKAKAKAARSASGGSKGKRTTPH